MQPVTTTRAAGPIDTVKRVVPEPVKQAVKAARAGTYYAVRSRLDMAALKRDFRNKYGPGFVYDVHDQDEMYKFAKDFWYWPFHVVRMKAPSDAMRTYLVSGDENLRDLETVLRDQGRDLSKLDSFLEFASGFGRFTRFLVRRLDPSKVTVSDISPTGVDFAKKTFGVSGFYSAESASELDHDKQYEVVFVASLFSHLAIEHWGDWLRRLYDLVTPGGLLIFSAHGPYARDVVFGEGARPHLEVKADGFTFLRSNETRGRLEEEYYGSAFVTEEFVKGAVAEHGTGTIQRVYPHKLWGTQDIYVIEKPAAGA